MTGEAQSNTLIFLLGKKIPSSMLTSALYSNMKLLPLLLIALDVKKQTSQKTCDVLTHRYGQELRQAYKATDDYNQGVVAALKSTATKCPSSSADFCQGWSSVKNRTLESQQ